jgi:hypothetical protein
MAASTSRRRGASASSSSDSESSDEEESKRLQEAAVTVDYFKFSQKGMSNSCPFAVNDKGTLILLAPRTCL